MFFLNVSYSAITKIKKLFVIVPIVLIVVVSYHFISTIYGYVDPINGCYISIDSDTLRNNKPAIVTALTELKKHDEYSYHEVCKNVTKIIEHTCNYMDDSSNILHQYNTLGCKITGSKIIYISPNAKDRADLIAKYGQDVYR